MAEDLLGLDTIRSRVARPEAMGFGGVSMGSRARSVIRGEQLDMAGRLAKFGSELAQFEDEAAGRNARDSAINQLSGLDASDPQFFAKANTTLANNPAALNDKNVMEFFNLKAQNADRISRERQYNEHQQSIMDRQLQDQEFDLQKAEKVSMEELDDRFRALNGAGQAEADRLDIFRLQGRDKLRALVQAEAAGKQHDNMIKLREQGLLEDPEEAAALQQKYGGFTDDAVADVVGRRAFTERQEAVRKERLADIRKALKDEAGVNVYDLESDEERAAHKARLARLKAQEESLLGISPGTAQDEGAAAEPAAEQVSPQSEKNRNSLF